MCDVFTVANSITVKVILQLTQMPSVKLQEKCLIFGIVMTSWRLVDYIRTHNIPESHTSFGLPCFAYIINGHTTINSHYPEAVKL